MKARVVRLLLLAAVFTVIAWTPSYSWADPLCPTAECLALQSQCIAEGGNHDYFGYRVDTGLTCQGDPDIRSLQYIDCCRLPGCTELIWRGYCYY